jgi:hypothetical protein
MEEREIIFHFQNHVEKVFTGRLNETLGLVGC